MVDDTATKKYVATLFTKPNMNSLPETNNGGARGPNGNNGKPKTALIFLLGLFFLGPVLWVQWDLRTPATNTVVVVKNYADLRQQSVNASVHYGTQADLDDIEVNQQTRLVGTALPELPEPERECLHSTDLPELVSLRRWSSEKPAIRESITILTQLSADRLSMLENQCRTWPDPIVAVVYVPLIQNETLGAPTIATYVNTTLDDVIRGMNSFHLFMESTAMCALEMELVGQFIDLEDPLSYPINALRNRALVRAKTELVFLLDVDFVASPLLGLPSPGYREPTVFQQLIDIAEQKRAIVLPAFEITNRRQDLTMAQNFARSMIIAGKDEVRRQYKAGLVDAFNGRDAPWGHGPTNTSKWIKLNRPIVYRVKYQPQYEPFIILSRQLAPWFDERFVGYGGNKIAYINQLHGVGFQFKVHPFGFTIHVPHVRTRAANIFVARKHRGVSTMDELRQEVQNAVEAGNYIPMTLACENTA